LKRMGDEELEKEIVREFIREIANDSWFVSLSLSHFEQAVNLVKKVQAIPNWEKYVLSLSLIHNSHKQFSLILSNRQWKLITIFIGGNDLCVVCDDPVSHDSTAWTIGVKNALDYLAGNPFMTLSLLSFHDKYTKNRKSSADICQSCLANRRDGSCRSQRSGVCFTS